MQTRGRVVVIMRELKQHIVEGGPPTVRVFAEEELGPGGAPHHYEIEAWVTGWRIDFQFGGVLEAAGVNGVSHEALLAIIIDRLEHFQAGPYPSPRNDMALDACRQALHYLQARTRERIERGVEGKSTA